VNPLAAREAPSERRAQPWQHRDTTGNLSENLPHVPPADVRREYSPPPRAFRSPHGSALRRSSRYSPYQREQSEPRSSEDALESPTVTRRVMFSPLQRSPSSAPSPSSPAPVHEPPPSTPARSPSPTTPSQSPRTPRTPRLSTTIRSPRTPRTLGSSRRSRPSPLKTGRLRDLIWKHYTIERENGKKHGRCIYCGTLKRNGKPSANLLNHLVKPNQCPSVPRAVQISLRPTPAPPPASTTSPAVQPAAREMDQDTFELALARLVFVCALPFILVEAQVFRDFIALLAPSVKIPSRQKLSMVLLKRVRDEIRLKVIEMINAHTFMSLVTDGWTDTNGSSIINFMVVAPGLPSLFWSSWSTRSKKHTARYLAGEIEKVIEGVEHETTAQVVGVVTDNAKNMRSATNQVQSRRPNVISGGCSAHVLNLLMQDISHYPVVKAVLSRAVTVTRFVRDHLALYDELKQLQQGVRDGGSRAKNLVLPVPTRCLFGACVLTKCVEQPRNT
jgi:hypothetical protein